MDSAALHAWQAPRLDERSPDSGADAQRSSSPDHARDSGQSGGQETPGGDAQELTALQKLATVSPAQAEQAAVAAVPGSVSETQLDVENGFVVYSLEINGADGTVTEVVVDAGNATVLTQQAQDAGDPADQPGQAGDQQD